MTYLTGDTHGQTDYRFDYLRDTLLESDVLIVLGDFGFSWNPLLMDSYKEKFLTLSVLGNHENYSLIETLPLEVKFGGRVRRVNDNTFYLLNGESYEIEGKTFFVFGGASSIDKIYRTPYASWWPEEVPSFRDFSLAKQTLDKLGGTFDYFLTHTAERSLLKKMFGYSEDFIDPTEDMIKALKDYILDIGGSYKEHFFGHHHQFSCTEDEGGHKATCLYEDVLNLSSGEFKFFSS